MRFECAPTILRVQRTRRDGSTLVIEAGQVYETDDSWEIGELAAAHGLQRLPDEVSAEPDADVHEPEPEKPKKQR